jgi:hypothetical protein
VYNILVRKHEGKWQLGTPRRGREDNIKLCLKVISYEGVDWIHVAYSMSQWLALENTVMKLRVP